ncbi:MFS transporter [Streptomyces sp. 3MP-14]|uniref:MFS transporter n=1 Tax=Streptomyces mimosae TaxID=2586635 RepID=A0A5N6A3I9_9ACTN|nr:MULTISPECIES: MFS transporter [Streptomyces]KAB8162270.1 MFS transporter [Streptomyces mimosae]KAB8173831.1 MFS transporter [Streptomyces sp. 3MP-14]
MTVAESSARADTATDILDPPRAPDDSRFGSREWTVLITLCCATFMCGLDFSIVTVALPEIGSSLGFSSAGTLQWVATASLLPSASLLPFFARVSDLVGRKRLFTIGVALFTLFSLGASVADSPGQLIATRVGQGTAAAMIAPAAIALLTGYFPEGPRRARALGLNGAVMSLGFVLGALGGGVITSGLNWRWTMVVLCLMGALALVGAFALPPIREPGAAKRMDIPGAVLATFGLFGLVYGIATGGDEGWGRPEALVPIIGGLLLLVGFLLVERSHPEPLVPLNVLRRPKVSLAGLFGVITFGMCAGTTVLLSLYMQDVLGWSPMQAGLGYLGEGAAAVIGGMLVGRLLARVQGAVVLAAGLAIQGVGTAAMFTLPEDGNVAALLITSSIMGLGHVFSVVAFISVMTSGVTAEDQGVVGGLSQLPQYIAAIGVAALTAIAAARTSSVAGDAVADAGATLSGLHAGMVTAGVVALAGAALAGTVLRKRTAV